MSSYFPYGGAGDVPGYWAQNWSGATACQPVDYQTSYSMSARDDYKRCICDLFGEGAADCPTAEDQEDQDNQPDEESENDEEEKEEEQEPEESEDEVEPDSEDEVEPDNGDQDGDSDDLIEFVKLLNNIKSTPLRPYDGVPRSFSQVGRELDLIEDKLTLVLKKLSEQIL